jgi:DNA-3-methyladenine glycosylase I
MNKPVKERKEHKAPWECTLAKEEKSDCRPGEVPKSDKQYFEILSLCVLQAGLGWGMVRKNWVKYKRGFKRFNINKLADTDFNELLQNKGTIKNRKKVLAIINNAKEFQKIGGEYGSFSNFLDSLKEGSDDQAIIQLTQRFNHLGRYSAEYFLHSVGYW